MSAAATRANDSHYKRFGSGEAGLAFNNRDGPLKVPGLPYPITVERSPDERFAHGASDWAQDRLTGREMAMLGLMNDLTDRPGWESDIFDDAVVSCWRQEALSNAQITLGRPMLTPPAWDWCVKELQDKAREQQQSKYTLVFDSAARVCKSDVLVPSALLEQLRDRLAPVLDKSHSQPGQSVLHHVDPSLYPFIYGRTRAFYDGTKVDLGKAADAIGQGWTVKPQFIDPHEYAKSRKYNDTSDDGRWRSYWRDRPQRFSKLFQWLPCEVDFTGEPTSTGRGVKITSYINNLHPTFHRSLYQTIEKIVSLSIAPWNDVLVWRGRGRTPPRIRTFGAIWSSPFPEWAKDLEEIEKNPESKRYQEARELVREYMSQKGLPRPEDGGRVFEYPRPGMDWEAHLTLSKAVDVKHRTLRHWLHPEPGLSYTYEDWRGGKVRNSLVPPKRGNNGLKDHEYYDISLENMFRADGLQVVVDIQTVELSPDQPRVPATQWQLSGSLNEHIVATSILHFDSVNVTPNSGALTFRVEADLDPSTHVFEPGHAQEIAGIYDIHDLEDLEGSSFRGDKAFQTLGTVLTPDSRLVVFPNVFQHKLSSYRLQDESKPGRRRVMAIHLVDPHYRILSTRNVPPQRSDWWEAAGAAKIIWARQGMPQEIVDKILADAGEWPIGKGEAWRLKELLFEDFTRSMDIVWRGAFYYNFG